MKKMRATYHNGRTRVDGSAFNPKHNDRDFSIEDADNIDPSRSQQNLYWNAADNQWYSQDKRSSMKHTFKTAEIEVYKELFWEQYIAQQERYEAKRQYGRMKTFEEWIYTKLHCPEESYLQIGKTGEGNHPDVETMRECGRELIRKVIQWGKEHGDTYRILDIAFHFDEEVPQVHIRKVWKYVDADGNLQIGQKQALEQAGVELPKPKNKEGRHNNRKMTYDKIIREMWYDICEQHGISIEREPLPSHKSKTKERMLFEREEELARQVESFESERLETMQQMELAMWVQEQDLLDREAETVASAEADAVAIIDVAEKTAQASIQAAKVSEEKAKVSEELAQEKALSIVDAANADAEIVRQQAVDDAKATLESAETIRKQAERFKNSEQSKLIDAMSRENEARTARDAYKAAEAAYKESAPTVAGISPSEFAKRLVGRMAALLKPRSNPIAKMANFGNEGSQPEQLGNRNAFAALGVVRKYIDKTLGGIEKIANDVAREIAGEHGKRPIPDKFAVERAQQAEKDFYSKMVGVETEIGGVSKGGGYELE